MAIGASGQKATGRPVDITNDSQWEVWLSVDPGLYMREVIAPDSPGLDIGVVGPLAELRYRGFDRVMDVYLRELALKPQAGDRAPLVGPRTEVVGPRVGLSFKGFDRARWRYLYEITEQPQPGDVP